MLKDKLGSGLALGDEWSGLEVGRSICEKERSLRLNQLYWLDAFYFCFLPASLASSHRLSAVNPVVIFIQDSACLHDCYLALSVPVFVSY